MNDRESIEPNVEGPGGDPVDFAKDEDVSRGFRQAVRDALAGHAKRGNKVVVWKDGRAVWISPKLGPGA